jgi:hypothetical protein
MIAPLKGPYSLGRGSIDRSIDRLIGRYPTLISGVKHFDAMNFPNVTPR